MKKLICVTILISIMVASCKSQAEKNKEQVNQATSYECVGKVNSIEKIDVGRGGATGKFEATMVEVQVTSSQNKDVKPGDIIYCELVPKPKVMPQLGREYVFKAKYKHPARAKGTYLLETDVMDLTR